MNDGHRDGHYQCRDNRVECSQAAMVVHGVVHGRTPHPSPHRSLHHNSIFNDKSSMCSRLLWRMGKRSLLLHTIIFHSTFGRSRNKRQRKQNHQYHELVGTKQQSKKIALPEMDQTIRIRKSLNILKTISRRVLYYVPGPVDHMLISITRSVVTG